MKTKKLLLALLIILFGINVKAQTATVLVLSGYGGATSVGIGHQLEIDAFFIPADQAQALTWTINNNPGDATIDTAADTHCIITGVAAGMVTITATTSDGSLTASIDINIVDSGSDIWVSAIIVQGEGDVTTITSQGGTLQMIAVVIPQDATDQTYTWSVENQTGSATISTDGLLTAVSDGNVTVKATANDASATEGTMVISISNQTVGFENSENLNVSCYPNPAHDMLFIENTSDLNINKLEMFNQSGKLVKEASLLNNSNNKINVSDLSTGVYILKLYDNKKVIISKRIIIK